MDLSETDQLLTIADAAKRLGVSTKTLRRWEKAGTVVPQRTMGNQRRYTVSQIQNLKFKNQNGDAKIKVENFNPGATGTLSNLHPTLLFFAAAGFSAGSLLLLSSVFTHVNGQKTQVLPSVEPHAVSSPAASSFSLSGPQVLAAETISPNFVFNVNVPATFNEDTVFTKDVELKGKVIGENILNGLTAGTGISVGSGSNPTITNTGITSLSAGTGISVSGSKISVSLTAGTGISVSGSTITNSDLGTSQKIFKTITVGSDSFSAGSNTDTLTFAGGTGITVTPDTTNKKLTITASGSDLNVSGWTDDGTAVRLTTSTDAVGIGTSSPSTKLHVVGATTLAGAVTLGSTASDALTFTGRLANGTSIVPNTDLGSDLGTSALRFNNLWVANINSNSSQSFSGQTTFSYAPTAATLAQASVIINPTTSVANGIMLGTALSGYMRAGVDVEGDLTLGYSSAVSIPTSDYPLNIYGHSATRVSFIDTSGNAYLAGNVGVGTTNPAQKLHVEGQCITGDSLLSIVPDDKQAAQDGSQFTVDSSQTTTVQIKDVKPGTRVYSRNETTGKIEAQKINKLLDMGVKPIFKLKTEGGKEIRTTGNHPYLVELTSDELNSRIQLRETGSLEENIGLSQGSLSTAYEFSETRELWTDRPAAQGSDFNTFEYSRGERKVWEQRIHPVSLSSSGQSVRDSSLSQVSSGTQISDISASFSTAPTNSRDQQDALGTNKLSEETDNLVHSSQQKTTLSSGSLIDYEQSFVTVRHLSGPTQDSLSQNNSNNSIWVKVIYLQPGDSIATVSFCELRSVNCEPYVVWDKIQSIEYVGYEQVYDIEVEDTHNFIANGILAHNTYMSGNVGIGTTGPSQKLEVNGQILAAAGSSGGFNIGTNGNLFSSASNIYLQSVGDLYLKTNNGGSIAGYYSSAGNIGLGGTAADTAAKLYIQSTGNVGIGTTGPGATLDINGNLKVATTIDTQQVKVALTPGSNTSAIFNQLNNASNNKIAAINIPGTDDISGTTSTLLIGARGPGQVWTLNTSTFNGFTNPTLLFANTHGADSGDSPVVVMGGKNSTVTGTWYWDIYGVIDAMDGSVNATTTETVPVLRLGSSSATTGHSLTGNDVLFGGQVEVDGTAYFDSGNSIITSGNVGIGTTSPLAKLDIAGDASASGSLYLRGTGTSHGINLYDNGNLNITTSVGGGTGTTALYVKENGNVGIGTTGPGAILEVVKSVADQAKIQIKNQNNGAGAESVLSSWSEGAYATLKTTSNATGNLYFGMGTGGKSVLYSNGATQGLGIGTYDDTPLIFGRNNTEYMRIGSSGNVGIGTTGPGAKLQIVGADLLNTTQALNVSGSSGTGLVVTDYNYIGLGTTLPGSKFVIDAAGATNDNYITYQNSATARGYIGVSEGNGNIFTGDVAGDFGIRSQSNLLLGSGGNNVRVYINSTGNVGIGTTGPQNKMEISGNSAYLGINGSTITGIKLGDVSPANKAVFSADYNSGEIKIGSTHSSYWPSFYSGNTEVMRITTVGNVGIGTTGPGALLEVNGANTALKGQIYINASSGQNAYLVTNSATDKESGILINENGTGKWYFYNDGTTDTLKIHKYGDQTRSVSIDSSGNFNFNSGQAYIQQSSGNVGIGTTGPGAKLEIVGAGTGTKSLIVRGNTSNDANIQEWQNNSGTVLASLNNVGTLAAIGLTSRYNSTYAFSLGLLDNAATAYRTILNKNDTALIQTHSGGIYGWGSTTGNQLSEAVDTGIARNAAGVVEINNGTAGQYRDLQLRAINPTSGNVGIGTTGPSQKLDVAGSIALTGDLRLNASNIYYLNQLTFNSGSYIKQNYPSNFDMAFATGDPAAVNMVIKANGNVGIGTTGPGYKLDVSGTGNFTDSLRSPTFGISSGDGLGSGISLYGGPTVGAPTYGLMFASTGTFGTYGSVTDAWATYFTMSDSLNRGWIFRRAGTANVTSISGGGDIATAGNLTVSGTGNSSIAGNVGIGTTGPSSLFHLNQSANSMYFRSDVPTGFSAYGMGFYFNGTQMGAITQGSSSFTVQSLNNANMALSAAGSGVIDLQSTIQNTSSSNNGTVYVNDTFTTSGNVGIGTTGPGAKLEINGSLTASGAQANAELISTTVTGAANGDDLRGLRILPVFAKGALTNLGATGLSVPGALWTTTGTGTISNAYDIYLTGPTIGTNNYSLYIDSGTTVLNATSGNVGIGTTGPTYPLHIYNADAELMVEDNSGRKILLDAQNARMRFLGFSSNTAIINTDDSDFAFGPGGTERVRFTTGGNVGIGTTGPATVFDVYGVGGTYVNVGYVAAFRTNNNGYGVALGSNNSNGYGAIQGLLSSSVSKLLINPSGGNVAIGAGNSGNTLDVGGAIAVGSGYAGTALPAAAANGMAIQGNVGIGTTGPSQKLDVAGNIALSTGGYIYGDTTTPYLRLSNSSGTFLSYNNNSLIIGGSFWNFQDSGGTGRMRLYTTGGFSLGSSYGGTDPGAGNMIISGNVGIGTTSPTGKLHVSGAVTGKALSIFDETGDQNILVASASGTPRFVITNAGNVGIGTTGPGYKLDVAGQIYSSGGIYSTASSGSWPIMLESTANSNVQVLIQVPNYSGADRAIQLNTGGASYQIWGDRHVFSSGNVGIGTTGPAEKLEVYAGTGGNSNIKINGLDPYITLYSASGFNAEKQWRIQNSNDASHEYLKTSLYDYTGTLVGTPSFIYGTGNVWLGGLTAQTAPVMAIQSSGNVGIGTTGPAAKFHIQSAVLTGTYLDSPSAIIEAYSPVLNLIGSVGGSDRLLFSAAAGGNSDSRGEIVYYNPSHARADQMAFELAGSEKLTILSSGNVGIGTTGPGALLDVSSTGTSGVVGARFFAPNLGSSQAIDIQVGKSSSTNNALALGYYSLATPVAYLTVWGDNPATGQGLFYQKGGNVGIGTTGPSYKLDVAGSLQIGGVFNVNNQYIANAKYLDFVDSGLTWSSYISDTNEVTFGWDSSNNLLHTRNNAGNAVGLDVASVGTEKSANFSLKSAGSVAVTIATSGNVGIGTTGPSSKLEIVGTATFGAAGVSVLNAGAHTVTLTASPATFRSVQIGAMTLSAGSAQTVTTASSLYVDTPVAGTNVTITNNKPIDTGTGAYLSSAGVWTDVSGRESKENFQTLDMTDLLAKIGQLPIDKWSYKTDNGAAFHIGPVAEDFYKTFGVGNDDTHLAALDTAGVALAGVKGLLTKQNEKSLDMAVLGKLSAQGAVEIGGPATFRAETIFEKLVNLLGDVIFKGKVLFAQAPTFGKDTAGWVVITSGSTQVKVEFEKEYEFTPVINLTLRSPVRLDYLRVKDESTKGFTIEILPTLAQDIGINWMAIQTQNANIKMQNDISNIESEEALVPSPTPTATASPSVTPSAQTTPQPSATPTPTIIPTPTVEEPLPTDATEATASAQPSQP